MATDPQENQPELSTARIHLIESDPDLLEYLTELLESDFAVKSFSALKDFDEEFFSQADSENPALILCDSRARDGDALDALKKIREVDQVLPFILMVTHPDDLWMRKAYRFGVTDLIEKPFEPSFLVENLRGRIEQSKLIRKNSRA
jgi:DNA-binding NtrC family response regulator